VKKFIVLGAGVAAAAASMALVGTGVAGAAPDVTGQTFSEASAALSGAGLKAVVSSAVGDQKAQSDCVVTRQRTSSTPQNGSHPSSGTKVLLSLNCYATQSSATSPGYSAASPEGRAAAAAAAAAAATPSG
jgi:beta-lactam-binding protein with PASTA domain